MRQLKGKDLYAAMRVVRAAGMADEVKAMAAYVQQKKTMSVQEVGLEFILRCIEKLSDAGAETAMWAFLGGVMEMPAKDVADMPLTQLLPAIQELLAQFDDESYKAFFTSLSVMMK